MRTHRLLTCITVMLQPYFEYVKTPEVDQRKSGITIVVELKL